MSSRPVLRDYTLVLASPEQVTQHCRAEHVPWSKGVDFQTFYDEQVTRRRTGPWAQDLALLTWVLVKRSDPLGEVYAACETYRRRAFVKHEDTGVRPTFMYGIASVVTPVHHRRNGFATHMLCLLHYMLGDSANLPPFPTEWGSPSPLPSQPMQVASTGEASKTSPSSTSSSHGSFLNTARPDYLPPGIGSILWSDVGSHFYSKCTIGLSDPGWLMETKDNVALHWELSSASDSALEGWEILYQRDLSNVAAVLSTAVESELGSSSTFTWAADPETRGLLDFTPLRNPWSEVELRPRLNTLPVGLRKTINDQEVIVLFATHNEAIASSLLLTLLHNVTSDNLSTVLDALDVMGRKEGRTEGIMWGLETFSDLALDWQKLRKMTVNGPRPEKDGHLLGVAWYGPKSGARGRLLDTQMWPWC